MHRSAAHVFKAVTDLKFLILNLYTLLLVTPKKEQTKNLEDKHFVCNEILHEQELSQLNGFSQQKGCPFCPKQLLWMTKIKRTDLGTKSVERKKNPILSVVCLPYVLRNQTEH